MTENTTLSILNLSDDVILHIFSYLSSWDMLNVMGTCRRFEKIGFDHSLWNKADFRDGQLSVCTMDKKLLNCLQNNTKELHLRGFKSNNKKHKKWNKDLLTGSLLEKISKKAPDLVVLSLEEAIINVKKIKIIDFNNITNLKMLSIVKCELVNIPSPTKEGSYFKNIQYILPYLEHLEISHCNWLTDYDLLVLSKLDNLKSLDLKNCMRIGITLAYFSLCFRFGFKGLECINLRGTGLKNGDIQSVVQIEKLRALYIGPCGENIKIVDESSDQMNLVMSDPQRRAESTNKIVVINFGPNGPNWKHANPDELEDMGLDWVMNGICKDKINEPDDEDCFVPMPSTSKRKLEDGPSSVSKRVCWGVSTDEEDDDDIVFINQPECRSYPVPDENLSDMLIHQLTSHCKSLETLVLNGCAITDAGLHQILEGLRNLKYIDVTNTKVTESGVDQAKALKPECIFFDSNSE